MQVDNLNYEQLKDLPEEQKKEALLELQRIYGTNSAIAKKLGTYSITISNLFKGLRGEPIGRANKKSEIIKPKEPEIKLELVPEQKPKRKYNKKPKQEVIKNQPMVQENAQTENNETINTNIDTKIETKNTSKFITELDGDYPGTEGKERLNGLAGALLNNKQYTIKLLITEK
jgi:hypothetical protein